MERYDFKAMIQIRACKDKLTRQQYKTLRGQVLAGNGDGALKGLRRILQEREGMGKECHAKLRI